MLTKCVIFITFIIAVNSRSAGTNLNSITEDKARSSDEPTSYLGDFKFMYKVYQECASQDVTSCLKLKLVSAMDRAARSVDKFPIVHGVSFVKSDNAPSAPLKSEVQLEAELPRSLAEKDSALNQIILDKIGSFFQTHTLQIKFPTATEIERSFNGEERGKKKRMGGLLLIPLILGGTLVPLALGALALLAGKALIVSKLALVLAGIIGLKKLLGGGGGHESGHEVVVSGGHGSGWGRSYEAMKQEAQNLAYNAYAPKTTQ